MASNIDAEKDIGVISIEDIKLWSQKSLKVFLSLRGKSTVGSLEALVARAYAAYEEGVPVNVQKEHAERLLLEEHTEKLKLDDQHLPDPLSLKKEWIGEEEGIKLWPRLYLTDITRFYKNVLAKSDIIQCIECEYKQGKAYRYFTNNFIGEVFIHNLTADKKYCFVKTKCVPSQRVTAKQYDVWAIIKKDSKTEVGGEIMSAYCTCTAGLYGSCNHVAGLLFRIEAAVLVGITQPTCTDILAEWNVPACKKQIIPEPISNFLFSQEKYSNKSIEKTDEERKRKKHDRVLFQPMSPTQQSELNKSTNIREELFLEIDNVVPKSCFSELMKKSKVRETVIHVDVPTIFDFANSFKDSCDPELDVTMLTDIFADSIYLNDEQINFVYDQTRNQSQSNIWIKQRHGRITASRFHRVGNMGEKLQQNPDKTCPEYLVAEILEFSSIQQTWQMKHGINMEVHAKKSYVHKAVKLHKQFNYKNPSMKIFEDFPYLSASPDLEINCMCHGPGLVEIKCPATLINDKPSVENYRHIEMKNNEIVLKESSPYYAQVQGQMAATKTLYCDFFVFSLKGSIQTRVKFSQKYWDRLLENLIYFWKNSIAIELLTNSLKNKMDRFHDESEIIRISKPPTLVDVSSQDFIDFDVNVTHIDDLSNIDIILE